MTRKLTITEQIEETKRQTLIHEMERRAEALVSRPLFRDPGAGPLRPGEILVRETELATDLSYDKRRPQGRLGPLALAWEQYQAHIDAFGKGPPIDPEGLPDIYKRLKGD